MGNTLRGLLIANEMNSSDNKNWSWKETDIYEFKNNSLMLIKVKK